MFLLCSYFFLVSTVIQAETRTEENIFNNNGWTPITREKVYSSLDERLFPKAKVTEARTNNELGYNRSNLENLKYSRTFLDPSYTTLDNRFTSSSSSSADFEIDKDVNDEHVIISNTRGYRKPKAILNDSTKLMDASLQQDKMLMQKKGKEKIQQSSIEHGNQYQVIEYNQQKEELEKSDSDITKSLVNEPSDNHYDIINKTHLDGTDSYTNEFTDKLLSILSSYNIRVNDDLSNYDLSRHSSRNPTAQEYLLVPIPIRLSNRYNSLNHLPVDPLLAVFLSNFGYYLPGHYGINNKYQNSYGYLASNNIHNNQPFGSYKIFADTDSWN